jgi:hypothetical protein
MTARLFSIQAMYTNYDYYGNPIETSVVETFVSDTVPITPEIEQRLRYNAEMTLRSKAKRMPHRFWEEQA